MDQEHNDENASSTEVPATTSLPKDTPREQPPAGYIDREAPSMDKTVGMGDSDDEMAICRTKSLLDEDESDDDGSVTDVTTEVGKLAQERSKESDLPSAAAKEKPKRIPRGRGMNIFRKTRPSAANRNSYSLAARPPQGIPPASQQGIPPSSQQGIAPPSQSIQAAHSWDGFIRQGSLLKTIVDGAMHKIRDSFGNEVALKRSLTDVDQVPKDRPPKSRRIESVDHASVLAREKTAQVLQLQRQLKDAHAQAAAMKAANDAVREETAGIQQRLDRTAHALRIAGSNAQKARGDADTAEANASSLAQTLQSLQSVVSETKRASQAIHQDHQRISSSINSLEGKLIHKENELVRAHKDLKTLRDTNEQLEESQTKHSGLRNLLEREVKKKKEEIEKLRSLQEERDALEQARRRRAEKVDTELRETQATLLAATSGQTQAEKTQIVLQETIDGLRKANENLHEQLSEQQEQSRKENERLSIGLAKAEKEAQKLRIDSEASNEAIQRLQLDKKAVEKQLSDLRNRTLAAERRAKEASSTQAIYTTPDVRIGNSKYGMSTVTATPARSLKFVLPPLSSSGSKSGADSSGKENVIQSPACNSGDICCICFKASYGLMKSCQCGELKCKKRAHISCVNQIQPGPSVSHPGTPAPRLPIILCSQADFSK